MISIKRLRVLPIRRIYACFKAFCFLTEIERRFKYCEKRSHSQTLSFHHSFLSTCPRGVINNFSKSIIKGPLYYHANFENRKYDMIFPGITPFIIADNIQRRSLAEVNFRINGNVSHYCYAKFAKISKNLQIRLHQTPKLIC